MTHGADQCTFIIEAQNPPSLQTGDVQRLEASKDNTWSPFQFFAPETQIWKAAIKFTESHLCFYSGRASAAPRQVCIPWPKEARSSAGTAQIEGVWIRKVFRIAIC
jgi:hypothetical protein